MFIACGVCGVLGVLEEREKCWCQGEQKSCGPGAPGGPGGRREEIACHVISFAAQPWNTTPIRVSDDSTGSFAGTNNDPALCPRSDWPD